MIKQNCVIVVSDSLLVLTEAFASYCLVLYR